MQLASTGREELDIYVPVKLLYTGFLDTMKPSGADHCLHRQMSTSTFKAMMKVPSN